MEDIVIQDLHKPFTGEPVLRDFSAVLPAGQVTDPMASFGADKIALLHILMGLEWLDGGTTDGLAGPRLSTVSQEDRPCDSLDPSANIHLINPTLGRREMKGALAAVGLVGCLRQPIQELSDGMRRRMAILRALLVEYGLPFLDEPLKGLDQETKEAATVDARRRCAGRAVLPVIHDVVGLDAIDAAARLDLSI